MGREPARRVVPAAAAHARAVVGHVVLRRPRQPHRAAPPHAGAARGPRAVPRHRGRCTRCCMQNVAVLEQKIRGQPLSDEDGAAQRAARSRDQARLAGRSRIQAVRAPRRAHARPPAAVDAIVGFAQDLRLSARGRARRRRPRSTPAKSFGGTMELAVFGRARNETNRRREQAQRAPRAIRRAGRSVGSEGREPDRVPAAGADERRQRGHARHAGGDPPARAARTGRSASCGACAGSPTDRAEIGLQVIANALVERRPRRAAQGAGRRTIRSTARRRRSTAASSRGCFLTLRKRETDPAVQLADHARRRVPAREALQAADAASRRNAMRARAPARAAAGMGLDRRRAGRARRRHRTGARAGRLISATMVADRYAEIHRAYRWDVPARFQIAHACCGRWADDRARFALYWEDESGAHGRVHVLGPRAAGEPPGECAGRAGRRARRQGRADPAAAPRDRRRAHRDLPLRRGRRAAVVPVRARGARIPAAELGDEGRVRRSAVAAERHRDPRAVPGSRARHRRRRRARDVASRHGRRCSRARVAALHAGRALAPADPALLVYTSGTTGPPKGALMPQQCLIGNLPGFVHSHDGYPRPKAICSGRRPTGRGRAA